MYKSGLTLQILVILQNHIMNYGNNNYKNTIQFQKSFKSGFKL